MLAKAYGGRKWRICEYTNLHLEEIAAKFPCRKQLPFATPMYSPLLFRIFVVFLQPNCSCGLLLAWSTTFQGCITEKPTRYRPTRRLFPWILTRAPYYNEKNNGTAYANPGLGMEIQRTILARQKKHTRLHWNPIVLRRRTTKGSECLRQKNGEAKLKEMSMRQKVNTNKYISANKRMLVSI